MNAPAIRSVLCAVVTACVLWASASSARAQVTSGMQTATPVTADFKGMVGLGLIGAELGLVIPALAGAEGTWPYVVFPVLGAGGGAVAGYFLLESGGGHPEAAVYTLTAGLALVIPALVVAVAATAYDYEADAARNAQARYRPPSRAERVRASLDTGALRLSPTGVRLAPPAVGVVSLDPKLARRTGLSRDPELRVSVVSGQF
ncbi:MAG: hypothetical protein OEZ06_22455 [Myxococcales bacterium]|nr:hypothetical protein [Myxococcales bacterium]